MLNLDYPNVDSVLKRNSMFIQGKKKRKKISLASVNTEFAVENKKEKENGGLGDSDNLNF